MAKFLNTTGVSYHLEDLIKNTKEKLILISPYLQLNERIKEHITNLNIQKKDIRILYRENKLAPDETNWLGTEIGVRTSICKSLHAKCYLNEHEAIITSMNLYEFSQQNNNEMGIYIRKETDSELYNETYQECQRLMTISEEIRVTVQKIKSNPGKENFKRPAGYCIRTGVEIPFCVEKPLSTRAFDSWSKYADDEYPEKFCHFSGEFSDGETSYSKPILKKNWKKAKEMFDL